MKAYSLRDGEKLVKAARHSIELFLTVKDFKREVVENTLDGFDERHGVFVTLSHYPNKVLRGCIGFIEAVEPIKKLIIDAAIAAATEDPRFVSVSHLEFEHLVVEVSVLSKPERISGHSEELIKQIRIGKDGLIIEYGYHHGLLLPLVAVEEGWNAEKFLDNVCIKAGLPTHTWKQHGVSLYKFSTQVFKELEPRGTVEEVKLEAL